MKPSPAPDPSHELFAAHPRSFEDNRYVYPVVSRRAGGISVGVNLNLDQACNFNCIYCQVDRNERCSKQTIDPARLAEELDRTVALVASGKIYEGSKFSRTPEPLRWLTDIALSGDGEPTLCHDFEKVVSVCAEVRRRRKLDTVKLVLITNASTFDQDRVRRGLEIMDASNGEIWAKLDAGTEEYFRKVARTGVPLQRILDNLRTAALVRPIVIQSLLMRVHEEPPSAEEISAYCRRLKEIVEAGGRIKLVHIHTVARVPAESWVSALSRDQVDAIAATVRRETGVKVAAFYA